MVALDSFASPTPHVAGTGWDGAPGPNQVAWWVPMTAIDVSPCSKRQEFLGSGWSRREDEMREGQGRGELQQHLVERYIISSIVRYTVVYR